MTSGPARPATRCTPGVSVAADPRTNALLVDRETAEAVKALVERLDRPGMDRRPRLGPRPHKATQELARHSTRPRPSAGPATPG
jgi:hypothetical protein